MMSGDFHGLEQLSDDKNLNHWFTAPLTETQNSIAYMLRNSDWNN